MKDSTEFRGEIGYDGILKTEYGKQEFNNRLMEYRATHKTTERKLKDLLTYIIEKNPEKRFHNVEFKSEDLKKLDEATEIFTVKYDLSVDKNKLTMLRDRILSEELYRLEQRLQQIRGLIMIEGDWSVEANQELYIFKRPFMDNVTNPPICEVKLPKNSISSQERSTIEGANTKRIRLTVFGNVLTGMTHDSKTVFLTPIAVF